MEAKFLDSSVAGAHKNLHKRSSVIISKEEIDSEVERLANAECSFNGRRESMVVHTLDNEQGFGLIPGVDVTLSVLKPGEKTRPRRLNATQVAMCIRGQGISTAKGRISKVEKFDVWTMPSMGVHTIENTGDELFVCLIYSNAPLLRKLEMFYVEEEDQLPEGSEKPVRKDQPENPSRSKDIMPPIELGEYGEKLLSYEYLIDLNVVEHLSLHWPYLEVAKHLDRVRKIEQGYLGRRLYVLYNPATENRNGTTPSLFATIAAYGENIVDKPHRHSSASINYIMKGSGYSKVDGQRMDWKAGDLHLSAPAWTIHGHASGPEGAEILTIQDHPFHIANDSLIWQEDLRGPVLNLGSENGFQTNISDYLSSQD